MLVCVCLMGLVSCILAMPIVVLRHTMHIVHLRELTCLIHDANVCHTVNLVRFCFRRI